VLAACAARVPRRRAGKIARLGLARATTPSLAIAGSPTVVRGLRTTSRDPRGASGYGRRLASRAARLRR
jgi:hypothetical protein